MKFNALFAAATATLFVHVQAVIYPDVISLFENVTQVADLWAFLEQNLDVANQYTHLTNVTIFAASNEALVAFETAPSKFNDPSDRTILESILNYHIVVGQLANLTKTTFAQSFLIPTAFTNVTGGQFVGLAPVANNSIQLVSGLGQVSSVVAGPFYWTTGVVYVLDKVMQVPLDVTTTTMEMNLTATSGALNTTALTTSLGNTWDVTLFAPANAAFDAIGSAVTNMSSSDLTNLMEYHMLTGNVLYSSKFGNKQLRTAQGTNITMSTRSDGSVYVNNAKIIQKDILISDGVLHIIDNVMNPSNTTLAPTTASSGLMAFAGAHSVGQVPFTNIPLASASASPAPLNTTVPASSPSSSPKHSSSLSSGVAAAIVVASLVAIAAIIGGVCFHYRSRGYRVNVSRKSVVITHPYVRHERYELPEHGGHADKVELSAEKHKTVSRPLEPPTYNEDKKERPMRKATSPTSPLTPHDGIWELSAEHDVRQRIEAFLRPKDKF